MPLTVNSIVQVTYRSTYAAQRVLNVTNWKVISTDSEETLLADLNAILTHFKAVGAGTPLTAYRGCLATNVTINQVRAQMVRPTRSIFMEDDVGLAGTGGGEASTGNLASTVTRRSNAAGRKGVSVSHLGPFPVGNSVNGALVIDQIDALSAWAAEYISDQAIAVPAILLRPVILHAPTDVIVSTPVETYRIGTTTRTMRRRTVGLGE